MPESAESSLTGPIPPKIIAAFMGLTVLFCLAHFLLGGGGQAFQPAALAKLARLRQRVARFPHLRQTLRKLFSPNLEKALTFLDDSLLPATSNAVVRRCTSHSDQA